MCKKENVRVYDTIVIGGGLLGCFCALNLSRYSVDTALLEMREDGTMAAIVKKYGLDAEKNVNGGTE